MDFVGASGRFCQGRGYGGFWKCFLVWFGLFGIRVQRRGCRVSVRVFYLQQVFFLVFSGKVRFKTKWFRYCLQVGCQFFCLGCSFLFVFLEREKKEYVYKYKVQEEVWKGQLKWLIVDKFGELDLGVVVIGYFSLVYNILIFIKNMYVVLLV